MGIPIERTRSKNSRENMKGCRGDKKKWNIKGRFKNLWEEMPMRGMEGKEEKGVSTKWSNRRR